MSATPQWDCRILFPGTRIKCRTDRPTLTNFSVRHLRKLLLDEFLKVKYFQKLCAALDSVSADVYHPPYQPGSEK